MFNVLIYMGILFSTSLFSTSSTQCYITVPTHRENMENGKEFPYRGKALENFEMLPTQGTLCA